VQIQRDREGDRAGEDLDAAVLVVAHLGADVAVQRERDDVA
jgi:hypothetical protein